MSGALKLKSFLTARGSPRAGTSAAVEVAAKSGADADADGQCLRGPFRTVLSDRRRSGCAVALAWSPGRLDVRHHSTRWPEPPGCVQQAIHHESAVQARLLSHSTPGPAQ